MPGTPRFSLAAVAGRVRLWPLVPTPTDPAAPSLSVPDDGGAAVPATRAPRSAFARIKTAAPWLVAVAILGLVFHGIHFADLLAALRSVPLVQFILLVVATNIVSLLFDVFATTVAFHQLKTPVTFAEVLSIRGATYLLSLLSYGVGQGGMVYFLARTRKTTAARAGGVVLYTMGSTLLALAALASFAVFRGDDPLLRWYRRLLIAAAVGLVPYGVLVSLKPKALARRELLAPLFDGGVTGQAVGTLARIPHLCILLAGNFLCLRLFGVAVPPIAALTYLPILFLITAVPVTPQGLGTTQLAAQRFFTQYGPGGGAAAIAAVTAYSLCFQVGSMAAQALLGIYFLRRTTRIIAGPPTAT